MILQATMNSLKSELSREVDMGIADCKRTETALFKAHEMKLLEQLTLGVAHEVRNPLNGIMAIMGALAKELSDDERFEPYMQHMRGQVTRLTTLMDDLLLLGRPLREETMQAIPLTTLVDNAIATWKQTLQAPVPIVRVNSPVPSDQCLIRADIANMMHVIINLLENAFHHSPAEGEIHCEVKCQIADRVILSIKDCGKGIPQEFLPKLFDPFFTTRKGNTGLGLSIVRHIVEIHQGSVFALNNTPDPGATFQVVLPRYTPL
jgi:signal transduction histidine kinase